MTNYWYITFRSITFAQKAQRLLQRSWIDCVLMRAPRALMGSGCGYCLRIHSRDVMKAVELLKEQELLGGKLYTLDANGKAQEQAI